MSAKMRTCARCRCEYDYEEVEYDVIYEDRPVVCRECQDYFTEHEDKLKEWNEYVEADGALPEPDYDL